MGDGHVVDMPKQHKMAIEILYNNWCRGLNFYLSVQLDIHVQVEACLPRGGCVLFPQRPQVKEERPHEDDNQWCYTVETKNKSPETNARSACTARSRQRGRPHTMALGGVGVFLNFSSPVQDPGGILLEIVRYFIHWRGLKLIALHCDSALLS